MRIFWGSNIEEGIGNAFGYYVHNKNLREAVRRHRGVDLVDSPEKADAAIYIAILRRHATCYTVLGARTGIGVSAAGENNLRQDLIDPD